MQITILKFSPTTEYDIWPFTGHEKADFEIIDLTTQPTLPLLKVLFFLMS